MTAARQRPAVPAALTAAARLRHDGRVDEAMAVIDEALTDARSTPFDGPFRERVLLSLALVDFYVRADLRDHALKVLAVDTAFADDIVRQIRQSGSPDQIHSAEVGSQLLRDRATQVALEGHPVPEIEVAHWTPGEPANLAQLRGRVVLLEFWAPTCRSCLAMFPTLGQLQERYRDQGLTVLALTRYGPAGDDPPGQRARERDLVEEVADRGLGLAIGIAPDGQLQETFGATAIPTFVLIDRLGVVRLASSIPDKKRMEREIEGLLET